MNDTRGQTARTLRLTSLRAVRTVSLCALLATSLVACASNGGGNGAEGDVDGAGSRPDFTADQRLNAGDYDGAVVGFRSEIAELGDTSIRREKLLTAERLAASRHAERAVAAADQGDSERAAAELRIAQSLAGDAATVRRATTELTPRLAAAQQAIRAKNEARALMDTDPARAQDILAEARKSAPLDDEIVSLLRRATLSSDANRDAARAATAWGEGARRRAIDMLATAVLDGKPVEAAETVRRRMETDLLAESKEAGSDIPALRALWRLAIDARLSDTATTTLRERYVARLLSKASELAAKGSVAVAAIFELEAEGTGAKVETRAAERVRTASALTLAILPFDDETGGAVDGLRLARAVSDRIASDASHGSMLIKLTDHAANDAVYPVLVVKGAAVTHRLAGGRVGVESRPVRYAVGTRDVANPATDDVLREIDAARDRMAAAQEALTDAQTRLKRLEELPFVQSPSGGRISAGDAAYQTKLAVARANVDTASRRFDIDRAAEAAARERLRRTPTTSAETKWAETTLQVTTMIRTCQMTARVTLTDGGRMLLDDTIAAAAEHRETIAPAVPAAGIPADRDETPDDAEMSARAVDRLAGALAGRIRSAAEEAARPLLLKGREHERANDKAAAAESYALYLLSTPETATPERAAAARAIYELTGLRSALRTGYEPEVER